MADEGEVAQEAVMEETDQAAKKRAAMTQKAEKLKQQGQKMSQEAKTDADMAVATRIGLFGELLYALSTNCENEDEALELYSNYAQFEEEQIKGIGASEAIPWDTKPIIGDDKTKRDFFQKLSEVTLEIGTVPKDGVGDIAWSDATCHLNDFLPDDKEFQLSLIPYELWEGEAIDEKPEAIMGINDSSTNLENLTPIDKGDVLWRLRVDPTGFPFGEEVENGICILREHHRQVMFVALSWLYQNGVTTGLTSVDKATPPAAVVSAICGSPGIGKSRSLIFLLWFLLQKKSPFLLEAGSKDDRFFALVRPRTRTVRLVSVDMAVEILKSDRSILCIVDPAQTQYGKDPELSRLFDVKGPLCVTSPSLDPLHLPRSDKEATMLVKFSVSPWSLPHLQAVRPYFSLDQGGLKESTVAERFNIVGGVPRAIFRDLTYNERYSIIHAPPDNAGVENLLEALMRDREKDKMVKKIPQALLAQFSKWPFAETKPHNKNKCVWIGFLSQGGEKIYGDWLFEKMRTEILKYDDFGSASMFFERWVGLTLTTKATDDMENYRLCEFTYDEAQSKGVAVPQDIKVPANKKVLRYTDESLLLSDLPESAWDGESLFPQVEHVLEAPRGTAVYDFAIDKRCVVNATTGENHSISKPKLVQLIHAVGATADNPLHLVFFTLNERIAMKYAGRPKGEKIEGDWTAPDVTREHVGILRTYAKGECSNEGIKTVAEGLGVDTEGPRRKKRKGMLDVEETRALPPLGLLKEVLKKVGLPLLGDTKPEKWKRLVNFVNGLKGEDPFGSMQFNEESVKQHVIAMVPTTAQAQSAEQRS